MTAHEIAAFFARRDELFMQQDAASLAADHTEDGVLESPTAGKVSGRDAIEKVYRQWFAAFPDLRIEPQDLLSTDDRVIRTVAISGINTGGFMGLPPTGKPFRISGVFLYRLSGGLIAHERRVYDLSGILLQLAGELGAALDSAQRYRETLERVRLEHDLRTAAQVQRALLPEPAYSSEGFELVATSLPCRAIGGDFFDYFELSRGAFGVALGDVAGKGPPAALLAAMLQGIFAAHAHLGGSAAETLARTNESLVRREVESRFATMLYAVLSHDGHLTYCNAGHNPPLLMGRRGLQRLEKGGLVIGAFKEASFEEEAVQLQCGDTVVMFSDGVSEALNLDDEEFGDDRLLECVRNNWELCPADLLKCLLDTVHQFTAGAAQSDDLTVLILRYLGLCSLTKRCTGRPPVRF